MSGCPLPSTGPKGEGSSQGQPLALCPTTTHSRGQEEVEGEEFKPGHSVTAADAVELDALVVIDVKPSVLSDCKQGLRVKKAG